tara:strand:- start:1319 stop:1975 length:657 start_codon:yes stop_codon:yes gene_type:complete
MEKEEIKQKNSDTEDSLNQENDTSDDKEKIKKVEIQEEKQKITPEDQIKDLEDKVARTLAEMENQRRRFEKEKDDAFEYGGFTFAKESLNLLDNLDRSKQSLENDEKLKNTDAIKKISEHLEIIYKDMLSIFKKNNIEPIISINKKLDPNLHQAMMEIEDDTKEAGTIVQEIQKGFLMKDRLLRPSLVCVSKKTINDEGNKDDKDKKTLENEEKSKKN